MGTKRFEQRRILAFEAKFHVATYSGKITRV